MTGEHSNEHSTKQTSTPRPKNHHHNIIVADQKVSKETKTPTNLTTVSPKHLLHYYTSARPAECFYYGFQAVKYSWASCRDKLLFYVLYYKWKFMACFVPLHNPTTIDPAVRVPFSQRDISGSWGTLQDWAHLRLQRSVYQWLSTPVVCKDAPATETLGGERTTGPVQYPQHVNLQEYQRDFHLDRGFNGWPYFLCNPFKWVDWCFHWGILHCLGVACISYTFKLFCFNN